MTGDTIGPYFVFGKTDVDTTPPELVIVEPEIFSGYMSSAVPARVTYFDQLSGVDTGSFGAWLNGDTVTSSFSVGDTAATATLTADLGENILHVVVSDFDGNMREKRTYFYMDNTGTPPVVDIVSPQNGITIETGTPLVEISFYDDEGGIDFSSLEIKVDGVDRTAYFDIQPDGAATKALWIVPYDMRLSSGTHTFEAAMASCAGYSGGDTSTVEVVAPVQYPTILGMTPTYGFHGDTVTIEGVGFSSTCDENDVFFEQRVQAEVLSCTSTEIVTVAPGGAIDGMVGVASKGRIASGVETFIFGTPHGYVTNYNNAWVTTGPADEVSIIDFDPASPGDIQRNVGGLTRPFDVKLSPDGAFLYVSDYGGDKLRIYETSKVIDSDTALKIIDIPDPQYIEVSPDGLHVFVGTYGGKIYTVTNHALRTENTIELGNKIAELEISPLHQILYAARNTGNTSLGDLYFLNIGGEKPFLEQVARRSAWRVPTGVAVKPTQDEVYVANNRSNASSSSGTQSASFSHYPADGSQAYAYHGAVIDPSNDNHDVNWPYDVIFDPRATMMYASFALGFAGSGNLNTSNNVGASLWPANAESFDAAGESRFAYPVPSPRGLAFAPRRQTPLRRLLRHLRRRGEQGDGHRPQQGAPSRA